MSEEVLITGTLAFDSIKTPYGTKEKILGGSGLYASMAASFLVPVNLVSVVGEDFGENHFALLNQRDINTEGIAKIPNGKTFSWEGYYEYDMNQAHSLRTDLNVLRDFNPTIPESYKDTKYVFLANIDPELQQKVLQQINKPKLIAMDTMNFWIENKKQELLKTISQVNVLLINDAEIRELMDTPNILKAARELIKKGCGTVIVKKGEHGVMMVSDCYVFAIPAYPLEEVKDPTGAGDTFAGGFISYLASKDDYSEASMRKAIVYGSALASYNVEDFGCERLKAITKQDISARVNEFEALSSFQKLVI